MVDRVLSLFLPGEVEEEEGGRMAAGTEIWPHPVLIIVLALSMEIQAKKVLPYLDFMSCSRRQPRIISGPPGGEREGERNPGQASQRRKQPNLISNNPTWHFPQKKRKNCIFCPYSPNPSLRLKEGGNATTLLLPPPVFKGRKSI